MHISKSELIKPLEAIAQKDLKLVGGKAASLGRLMGAGFTVPKGFVITTQLHGLVSDQDEQAILHWFGKLGAAEVAVRSSAVSEDAPDASWAGQLDTFLNVTRGELIDRIEACRKSVGSRRAQTYMQSMGLSEREQEVAVIVQAMVASDAAGVAFTANPTTNDPNEIVIEGGWGLGEHIVQGEITPESITLTKPTLKIVSRVQARRQKKDVLPDEQARELAELLIKVEALYGEPMDVEWAFLKGKFYLLQARPITTLTENLPASAIKGAKIVTKGKAGSMGLASGVARVITDPKNLDSVKEGEILIAERTTPDYVEAFTRVKGIVTDVGGVTSHAAIISRELGVPAVVDTSNGTEIIRTGDKITVNGSTGEVYAGEVKGSAKQPVVPGYKIEKTGNEIDDLLNSITGVYVDVRDLWPMPPGNLFPYFDVDQALSVYRKLKQLVESGMSLKDIAKLFGRAEQVRYLLINTGPASLKMAHNLNIADVTIQDQVKFTEWCIQIIKELTQEDPLCLEGKNVYWSQAKVDDFVSKYSWQEVTDEYRKAVDMLSINLYSMNWSFYWNYYGAAGYDIHGPYRPKEFKGSQLVIKDYFNPAPTELWPLAREVPFKSAALAQVYKDTDIKISFGNRIVNQGYVASNNSFFACIVDGKQVTNLKTMQTLAQKAADITKRQTKYVNAMEKMDMARMCAKLSFYIHKKFFLHFDKEWYPKADIEATIKQLGREFIDQEPPSHDRSSEFRRNVLDPRNYISFDSE